MKSVKILSRQKLSALYTEFGFCSLFSMFTVIVDVAGISGEEIDATNNY